MKKASYRFLARALLALSPFALFILLAELLLWLSGETVPITDVALRHDRYGPPSAYMPGLMAHQYSRFHYERVKKFRPKLLVLGSSRVWHFRQEMFKPDADFYNCCRTIGSVQDLREFFDLLPHDYAPGVLLLGVDSWWFNSNCEKPPQFAMEVQKDDTRMVSAHIYAYKQLSAALFRGDITPELLFRILARRDNGIKRYGLEAWRSGGFRNDGSSQALKPSTPTELRDYRVLTSIREGVGPYAPCAGMDEELLTEFVEVLNAFEKRGTLIVCFAPPYSSAVRDAFSENPSQASYWHDFRTRLPRLFTEQGWYYFDGSEPAAVGLDDRCLEDGRHPMETYEVALLLRLAENGTLRAALHLDPAYLRALLQDPRTTPWYPCYLPRANGALHTMLELPADGSPDNVLIHR